ncbi:hypothetical protein BOX15_Mlig019128g2 [Macrostomum lignano]|uniref:DUF5745 domain-containing protein n=1 Tax=Macrostomum lignano TaxID=282301 RepID=A0A267F5D9_9PLAT|nr:hypothetical protein BOX15_Mlig019128g2 [Macrostomum lignano]
MEEWQQQLGEQHYVAMANDLLMNLDLPGQVSSLTDIGPELLVQLFEAICCDCRVGMIRPAVTQADLRHNLACVIDSLANDVLHVSLSHIRPADLMSGNYEAIRNLLEIFHGLMEFLVGRSAGGDGGDVTAETQLEESQAERPQQQQQLKRRSKQQTSRKLQHQLHQQRLHHLYHHFSPSVALHLNCRRGQPAELKDAGTSPAVFQKQQLKQNENLNGRLTDQLDRIAGQAAEINELAKRLAELRQADRPLPQTPLPATAAAAAVDAEAAPNGDTSDEGIVQDRSPCETGRNSRQQQPQQQQPQPHQRRHRRLRADQVAWLPQPTPVVGTEAAGVRRVQLRPPCEPPPQQQRQARDAAADMKGRLALLAELLASERRQLRRREAAHERLLRRIAGDLRRSDEMSAGDTLDLDEDDEDSIIGLLRDVGGRRRRRAAAYY